MTVTPGRRTLGCVSFQLWFLLELEETVDIHVIWPLLPRVNFDGGLSDGVVDGSQAGLDTRSP
ncbi:hypothetical protein F2Q68_00031667 [Brassica cretica]|uniref:Uncharacterized protein n=1 Tax=Brassica cretica TaxID=69181 RepID=A0A8S9GFJ5_BRACR|nr:hypothetical protein F2Q68_00031667 [Brassica cretica]